MQTVPQSGLALYKKQIEASEEVANAVFQSAEKAEKLIFDAARQNFEEQLKFAQALAAARDPQGVATLQNAFFGHHPARAQEYQKQVMEIIMEANTAYRHAFETYMQGVKESSAAGATAAGTAKTAALGGGLFPMWDAAFKEFTKNATRLMQSAGTEVPVKAAAATKPRAARAR